MSRVNLDGKVWKDPRVKRLAKRRTWSLRETIGTLAAVWDVAYDNKTPIMRRIDVDTAAESDGFADDMVTEDLAEPIAEDLISVRLRGVRERIQYLLDQAERGRRGGHARAASADRADDGRLADAKQTLGDGLAEAKQCPALPPDPDRSPDRSPDQDHVREPRKRGTRAVRIVPSDWQPQPEDAQLAPEQLVLELAKFRDHEFAAAKSDWNSTWRNWQRKTQEWSRGQQAPRAGRFEPADRSAYPEGRQEL